MAARVRTWWQAWALRLLGLGLCVLAWRMIAHLVVMVSHGGRAGLAGYVVATLGFLAGSMGSALTVLGGHIFDEVRVSARWRRV